MTKHPQTYIKITAVLLLTLSIIGYSLFQARNLIRGPIIEIINPQNGSSLAKSLITIEGVARNISYISLNDRQIFIDEEGRFEEQLLLSYGYNIMTIKAKDKFGRNAEKTLELVYK